MPSCSHTLSAWTWHHFHQPHRGTHLKTHTVLQTIAARWANKPNPSLCIDLHLGVFQPINEQKKSNISIFFLRSLRYNIKRDTQNSTLVNTELPTSRQLQLRCKKKLFIFGVSLTNKNNLKIGPGVQRSQTLTTEVYYSTPTKLKGENYTLCQSVKKKNKTKHERSQGQRSSAYTFPLHQLSDQLHTSNAAGKKKTQREKRNAAPQNQQNPNCSSVMVTSMVQPSVFSY